MLPLAYAGRSHVLALASFLIPLALLLWFVGHYGVNVPHFDDWRMVDFIGQARRHELGFHDFYAQFNEHRILLPKVIFAASLVSGHWNLKLLMYCSVAVAALTCLLLLRLSAISAPAGEPQGLAVWYKLIVCVLVFSWAQFENWLWGFQVAWLLVNLGVVGAVTVLSSERSIPLAFRVGLAALCCVGASFSMAHGLFSWIAVLPVLLALRIERQKKTAIVGTWVVMVAITWLVYMRGYSRPHGWSYTAPVLHQVKHLLMLLGGPFFIGRFTFLSYIAGLFILGAMTASSVYIVGKWGTDVFNKAAPWLSLSLCALMFAAVNTVGRTSFGERTATASRYSTCMILLYVSLIHLWRLFRREAFVPAPIVRAGDLCIVGMIVAFLVVSTHQIIRAQELLLRGSADRACLEVSGHFDHRIDRHADRCFQSFGPGEGEEFWDRVSEARALLGFKETVRFEDDFTLPGKVDSVQSGEDVTVSGWVQALGTAEPTVFLSREGRSLIASAEPEFQWNLSTILGLKVPERQNWQTRVSEREKIHAWAYDRKRQMLVRIQ